MLNDRLAVEYYYSAALKFFDNTSALSVGDIVFAFPEPVDDIGMEYRVRRAWVERVTDKIILLFDMDNGKRFFWENNCKITSKNYLTFLLS